MSLDSIISDYKEKLPPKIIEDIVEKADKKDLTNEELDKVLQRAKSIYDEKQVDYGEPVGTMAAQSIGEPGTQMSVDAEEDIIVKNDDIIEIKNISRFVDSFVDEEGRKSGEWEICDVSSENLYVPSLTSSEEITWSKVLEVSRHPSPSCLLKLKTSSGRKIKATSSHSFVIKRDGNPVVASGDEISEGDSVPVISNINERCISSLHHCSKTDYAVFDMNTEMKSNTESDVGKKIFLDREFGRLFGEYIKGAESAKDSIKDLILDAGFSKEFAENIIGKKSNKSELCLPRFVYSADIKFVEGFFEALTESEGNPKNILGTTDGTKSNSVVKVESERVANGITFLLSRLGVYSSKSVKEDGVYIKIEDNEKKNRCGYSKSQPDGEIRWEEITEIEEVKPSSGYVYDLSVKGTETFTTSEGIITHNTMRTFHYAGVAEISITLGLPRLIEIVDARKTPKNPMMTIKLEEEFAKDKNKARKVGWKIEETRIKDIASIETNPTQMKIILEMEEETLDKKEIKFEDIIDKIEKESDADIQEKEGTIVLRPPSSSYRKLLRLKDKVKETKVAGIEGIKRVIIRKNDDEYTVYTEGSAFEEVLGLSEVDASRTKTNDLHEVYDALGIEAARQAVINEAIDTLDEQGLEVDGRHIMLVADIMTNDGRLKQIGRHGVSGEKESILARAAFEVTVKHLLEAGRKGDVDELKGIPENVIVGQPIELGTGLVDLKMDVSGEKSSSD